MSVKLAQNDVQNALVQITSVKQSYLDISQEVENFRFELEDDIDQLYST